MLAMARRRIAVAMVVGGALALLYGCQRVTIVSHEYGPAQVAFDGGVRLEIRTSGSWHSDSVGDSVVHRNVPPYTLALTVSGTLDSTAVTGVSVLDGSAGAGDEILAWEVSRVALEDSSRVYVVRNRAQLTSPTARVAGVLRVYRRGGVAEFPFAVDLERRSRQESRNRALEVLRGF